VLSGFLIGSTLLATRERDNFFSSFFVRRATRILPLYYVWVGLFLVLNALGARQLGGGFPLLFDVAAIPGWSYLAFMQNYFQAVAGWGPFWVAATWSLAIEVHFYLLAPLVVRAVPARYLAPVCAVLIVAVNLFRWWASGQVSNHALVVLTASRLDAPFIGMLFASLWARHGSDGSRRPAPAWGRHVAILAVAVNYLVFSFVPNTDRSFLLMMALTPFTFGFLVLALVAAPAGPATGRPAALLRWIGVRCYAIYLFHQVALHLLSHAAYRSAAFFAPGQGAVVIAGALLLTLALAAVSWRYLENPIIGLGRRWTQRAAAGAS
jgi:peptidoglycan/LPS O-acetylase OafA/YrhL